jgi:ferric enterobactin receptor
MKRILNIMVLMLLAQMVFSQQRGAGRGEQPGITGSIDGIVIDSVSKTPVEFASVELMDKSGQKLMDGSLTDDKGKFKFSDKNMGQYSIRVSFLGYQTKTITPVQLTGAKPDNHMGKILLGGSEVLLEEVQITDQRSLVESQVDKLVYNVANDKSLVGGDAVDVLRKVPMLSVDMDGNISLRGSQRVKILLNGKPSGMFSDNVADALKMFPSDEIENVEVITSPGAKYDGEGTAGIVNIVTRKKRIEGFSGRVGGFIGDRAGNGNANISLNKGRFGISARGGLHSRFPSEGTSLMSREVKNTGELVQLTTQNGINTSSMLGFRSGLELYYDINAFNSINSSLNYRGRGGSRNSTIDGSFENYILNSLYEYSRDNESSNFNQGIDWNIDYTKKFAGNKERELTFALQIDTDISTNENFASYSDKVFLEDNENFGINDEYIFQTDYVHPFSPMIKLESGIKGIYRDMSSDYKKILIDKTSSEETIDDKRTDVFNYHQLVYGAYSSLLLNLPLQISVKAGLRYEHTSLNGFFDSGRFDEFDNMYDNLFPSVMVQKKFKDFSSIKLSYSKRIQRPGLNQINPFINDDDPRNISYGNPLLKPERLQQIDLGYSKFFGGASVNASLYYKYTDQVIENFLQVTQSDTSETTYFNLGVRNSIGLNLFGSLTLFKTLEIRGNADIYTYDATGSNEAINLTNSGLQYRGSLNASYKLPYDWSINAGGHYSSPTLNIQGSQSSWWMYNMGIDKELWNKKATLGLRVVAPFHKTRVMENIAEGPDFYQISSNSFLFRSIGLSFSYQFGKLNFKERKTKISNDDLKRNGSGEQEG